MTNIRISYAEIEQAGARLENAREEITAAFQSLQHMVDGLVASGFVTDQASGRFGEAYREYSMSASTVVARLSDMRGFLTQAAQAMRDMDAHIAAAIR